MVQALSNFATIGDKGDFRKILIQFFSLAFQFPDPKLNVKSIDSNLKSQKSKTKKLFYPFYIGEYMAISSLTFQWHHRKLDEDLSQKQEVIFQCNFYIVINVVA